MGKSVAFPQQGKSPDEVLQIMAERKAQDAKWQEGRTWSLVYYAGEEITNLAKQAYQLFFHENALNPMAFPSLQKFETEVVAMTADLFQGDEKVVGSMTSGGTESIMMAVKTARDFARAEKPHIKNPEMILPVTVHPAFQKAAHYFGVKPVHIPLTAEYRADVEAARAAVNENTILMVGSAPAYPHGVIDPIEELAAIAREHQIKFHVDACLGGFMLPFLRELGYSLPAFDFRVPGVTSISADIHKYGYAAKGASVILYRDREYRKYQFFTYADWPGGLFASPTMTGTRPGGAIAAAWAVMNHLGMDGYKQIASAVMQTTHKLLEGINQTEGLYILGKPEMSVFAFASDSINIYALADVMESYGWHMDRQQMPACLHFMVTPAHIQVADQFLADLQRATAFVKENPSLAAEGTAAMYGMMGTLPDRARVKDFLLDTIDSLTSLKNN